MRIDLGRRNVSMTEQSLNAAKVCAALQEVGGVGMAQGVRVDAFTMKAGLVGQFFQ
jgi:hypothetical protein